MKVFATEKTIHNLIHKSIRGSYHTNSACPVLVGKNSNSPVMELDKEGDKQMIDKLNECGFCKGLKPKKPAIGSGSFMTAGTILQARDSGKARYKRHSKKDCWALTAKGSEVIELKTGEHDDLLSPDGRVRECMVCSGAFRRNVAAHVKPCSEKYKRQDLEPEKKEEEVMCVDSIETVVKLVKLGFDIDYIKAYIDGLNRKHE